ncbi:MAG: hypothetical protein K8U57_31570 [Planctomycetes bacterium]|nr:hypothetical protein [Planctomycetota bacterium]
MQVLPFTCTVAKLAATLKAELAAAVTAQWVTQLDGQNAVAGVSGSVSV